MKKRLLLTFLFACLIGGSSLTNATKYFSNSNLVATNAETHEKNYDYYIYSGSYYSGIDFSTATEGLNGSLRKDLTNLIEPKAVYAYSGGLAKELQGADEDPDNSSNMIYLYTRNSVKKNAASSWNREHCWPQSLSNGCWGTGKGGCDMLHIRPVYSSTNSSRNNLKYGDINKVNPVSYDGMPYGYRGTYFEPLDAVKGDVARIIMYTWTAWLNEYGSKMPSITNCFESYDVLMKWHLSDKPDELEGNRNDYAQNSNQKNRNPYVDHPEYAWKVFGEKCSSEILKKAKETYPETGYNPSVDVDVTGIEISENSISLDLGERKQLTANVLPTNATNQTIKWSSSNSNVASVTQTGLVTANDEGKCTITVTSEDGGYKLACAVEVKSGAIRVTGVEINDPPETGYTGNPIQLSCTISPEDATNKHVKWTSSNTTVATIDENGLLNPLEVGQTTIKVITEDKSLTDTCTIIIEKGVVHVQEVLLSTTDLEMDIDETRFIKPIISPENADNQNVTWTNSDDTVVECKKGLLKGLKEGSATITVITEDGEHMADCVVSVVNKNKPVESVTISDKTLSLMIGNEKKLTATINPSDAANQKVTWSSSDEKIATVDSSGLVTAISEGTATITVTTKDGNYTDTCLLTVTGKGQRGDPTKSGCSSSILSSSIIISITAISGIFTLFIKRKEK